MTKNIGKDSKRKDRMKNTILRIFFFIFQKQNFDFHNFLPFHLRCPRLNLDRFYHHHFPGKLIRLQFFSSSFNFV